MNHSRVMPPTYFLLALLAMVFLHFFLPVFKIIPSPWTMIGVIFLLAGILLSLAGDRLFRQVGTTIRPFEESAALVTKSVFRISRNPMYLGFALLLTGAAVLLGSLTPFVMIPVFVLTIDRLFIRAEEKMLMEKFGQDYLEYQLQVRRWI